MHLKMRIDKFKYVSAWNMPGIYVEVSFCCIANLWHVQP